MLKVAIAERPALEQLEFVVEAFDHPAGEPLVEVVEDDLPPTAQGAHELGQAAQAAPLDLGDPGAQAGLRRRSIRRRLADRAEGFLEGMQPSERRAARGQL